MNIKIFLSIPLVASTRDVQPIDVNNKLIELNEESTWNWWRKLRTMCEENSKLGVILELTPDLTITDEETDRWMSEPVKAIKISTSLFLTNRSGFPVLSKAHQKFVCKFFKVNKLKSDLKITLRMALSFLQYCKYLIKIK
jgi:protein arginine N-methyltransferase 5